MPADNFLQEILDHKRKEVAELHKEYSLHQVFRELKSKHCTLSFYDLIEEKKRLKDGYFFITEFKRKSPSEGVIKEKIRLEEQIFKYLNFGADAISVLTDHQYFGGSYGDLFRVSQLLAGTQIPILQKDFVIDEIQIALARKYGAHIILLIAAILEREDIEYLKNFAERLGMGVIVELHSLEDLEKVQGLPLNVMGVNNRDLNSLKVALNSCNYIASKVKENIAIIAESGIEDYRDFKVASQHAHGFLIGTSLLKRESLFDELHELLVKDSYLLKCCGIRNPELISTATADYVGINFSPVSKRKINREVLDNIMLPANAVAVFRNNSVYEIENILETYPFRYVQLYIDDVPLDFVKKLKKKILMAVSLAKRKDFEVLEQFAPYVDCFILDGPNPGSGRGITVQIPDDFPYPFLLAGGIHAENLITVKQFKHCIGIDVASGIETEGLEDMEKIHQIKEALNHLTNREILC